MVNSQRMAGKQTGSPLSFVQRLPLLAAAWLLPGAGHFILGKRGRGIALMSCVVVSFALGMMLRGSMFEPQSGDLLTTLIHYGGYIGDLSSGLLYLLAVFLGYAQPDVAGHSHDYGTKFLVMAGLFNILAMIDASEIAAKEKD